MTDENIMHELTGRNITITERVFSYPNYQGSVYRGTLNCNEVGIKVKYYNQSTANVPLEYQAWRQMQHPNVIRLFDCFWAWNGMYWYLVFVMEWCLWDAGKEIVKRKVDKRPFVERELWSIAKGLVDALALMQRQFFAHHNIQLQNIYPFSQSPKIGDFSCSGFIDGSLKSMPRDTDLTSVSPFLSPELRSAWAFRLHYNDSVTFKSDTYSLGVVLLSLAMLEVPQWLRQVHVPASQVELAVQGLNYSEQFKQMLKSMLIEDVDFRKDFAQLNVWLQAYH